MKTLRRTLISDAKFDPKASSSGKKHIYVKVAGEEWFQRDLQTFFHIQSWVQIHVIVLRGGVAGFKAAAVARGKYFTLSTRLRKQVIYYCFIYSYKCIQQVISTPENALTLVILELTNTPCFNFPLCSFQLVRFSQRHRAKCRQRWQQTTKDDMKWLWESFFGPGSGFGGLGKGDWEVALRKHPPLMRPTSRSLFVPHSRSGPPSGGKHAHRTGSRSSAGQHIELKKKSVCLDCLVLISPVYPIPHSVIESL